MKKILQKPKDCWMFPKDEIRYKRNARNIKKATQRK